MNEPVPAQAAPAPAASASPYRDWPKPPERFKVAFSFAGAQRERVRAVATQVEQWLGRNRVFFDEWYEPYIAGDDADLRLQSIYKDQADLVVVCISAAYNDKPWTRIEHRVIRTLTWEAPPNSTEALRKLPLRFGDGDVEGIPVNTIAPDVRDRSVDDIARFIVKRLEACTGSTTAIPPAAVPATRRRALHINKLSLLGLEFGPIDVPLPGIWSVPAVLVLLVGLAFGARALLVAPHLNEAARGMRMSHYEYALEQLQRAPERLAWWPELAAAREKAQLGVNLYQPKPDWQAIGLQLERQSSRRPRDADLLVMRAQYFARREENYEKATELAREALKSDPQHAEAWYLLGLDLDLNGDLKGAIENYRKAVEYAPDSPQYRGNLAHALLESGQAEAAITEYRRTSQYPLAQVEQAHALWSLGKLDEAAEAQRLALAMLDDAALMASFFNRRAWIFTLDDQGVRLPVVAEKRCYALLEHTASLRLRGQRDTGEFPSKDCALDHIKKLVAYDLCRYLVDAQPELAQPAMQLRSELGYAKECPVHHPIQPQPPRA